MISANFNSISAISWSEQIAYLDNYQTLEVKHSCVKKQSGYMYK